MPYRLYRLVGDKLVGRFLLYSFRREVAAGNDHEAAHSAVALQLGNSQPCKEGDTCAFETNIVVPGESARRRFVPVNATPVMGEHLLYLAGEKCERLTSGTCADDDSLSPDAPYLADRYCWPCRVRAAIDADGMEARAFDDGYAQAVDDVRWLADARAEYGPLGVKNAADYFALNDSERVLHTQAKTAGQIADMLGGTLDDAWGWLPSWRWDEWKDRHDER